jgi:glycosyltransferase involved in cell wall biosynthesis
MPIASAQNPPSTASDLALTSKSLQSSPRITVVTICFNAEQFIRRTLDSVLAQDYPNLEYFVIDGGSKDSTADIIAAAAEQPASRIAWWVSERDSGVSEAFNKGIARHTGDFIGFLNAGDYFYTPSALSDLVRGCDTSADLLLGQARLTFDPPLGGAHGKREAIVGTDPNNHGFPRHKLPTAHQAFFYHRRMWERYGTFREDYRYAMDYEHYLRFRSAPAFRASFAPVIVAERPLTLARNSFGNPSRTYREYLRADWAHNNWSGGVFNVLKFVRDKWRERRARRVRR